MRFIVPLAALLLVAAPAGATITVDGTRDAEYGAPIVVQTVQTQFADAMPPGNVNGSELNAAYAKASVNTGRLHLLLTGNHEPNFNKLDIIIDSQPGGENTLSGTPDYDFNPGGGWISSNLAGLTFDTGFEADYHLFSRWGSSTGPYETDFVDRQGGAAAMVPGANGASPAAVGLIAAGTISAGATGPNASGSSLTEDLHFAIDHNNAAGVAAGTGAADMAAAAAVSTGMEFSIDLADLGNPGLGDTILIAAMINNGDHNFLSNQVLGGLPAGTGNLGGDGGGGFTGDLAGVDFRQFPGVQHFAVTVVPEPASAALATLALSVAGFRKRRV